jgi:hypothetical protein
MNPINTHPTTGTMNLPLAFFAGPFAWGMQLFVGYGLSAQSCAAGTKLWNYAVIALAGLIILVPTGLAYRDWYRFADGRGMFLETEGTLGRQQFMQISTALIGTIFFLLVLMTGGTMIFLSPCPVISQPLP